MSEAKINRNANSITFIDNNVSFSQFGIANEVLDLVENQQQEIERLNNIINELEKMMKNDLECVCSMNENGLFNGAIDILEVYLDKLQELKGSDKE